MLDQVLSGLSNFITVALIARALDAAHFGTFVIGYALLTTVLSLVRARWGTQLSLAGGGAPTLDLLRRLAGLALVATPVLIAVVFVPALVVTRGDDWTTLLLVAAAVPLVCLQDLSRYAAIAMGRPAVAVASDGLWVLLVAVGWTLGLAAVPALLTWVGAAFLATIVGLAGLRVRPRFAEVRATLGHRHATGEVLAAGAVMTSLASFAALGAASLLVGRAAAGALRGASSLMAPVNTVFAFASIALLPVWHRRDRGGDLTFCARLSLLVVGAPAAWSVVLLLLPDAVGQAVLGDTWSGARSVLVWTAVEYAALGIAVAPEIGLQAREAARPLLRLQVLYSLLVVVGGIVGAVVADEAWVVAAGLAVASTLSAVFTWVAFVREVRTARRNDEDVVPVG
jgi:O-antigen/teichoic acid export membrane protein